MLIPNNGRYGIRADDNVITDNLQGTPSYSYQKGYFSKHKNFDNSGENIVVFDTLDELGGYLIQNGHHRWKVAQDLLEEGVKVPKLTVEIIPKPEGFKIPE